MNRRIKVAVQKSGRLSEDSNALLRECGIDFERNQGSSKLIAESRNFPVEFLYLRDDDIPRYVADGVAQVGIVGENVVAESGASVEIVERLGFSSCRLSIALPKGAEYTGRQYLAGKRIATSYPRLLQRWLTDNKIEAQIHEISGSVEIAPGIGLSDAICDLVSSGSTLLMNGLKEVEVVFRSEAVLIAHPGRDEGARQILDKMLFRIRAVQRAAQSRYVLLNAPNSALDKIIEILPGMKSPTIVPLAIDGWSSVHSVLSEEEFWENIESLRAAGAQGILVIPIEKMIL